MGLVLAAADHPVAAHGVSPYRPSVTGDVLRASVAGTSLGATAARTVGLERRIVDAGVAGGPAPGVTALRPAGARGDLVNTLAMTVADTRGLVEAGRQLGREVGTAGIVALGEIGVANTTVAAALACGLLGADSAAVTGLGSGADASMLDRKREVVSAAVGRARRAHPALAEDPLTALAELGGPELAVLAGVAWGRRRRARSSSSTASPSPSRPSWRYN